MQINAEHFIAGGTVVIALATGFAAFAAQQAAVATRRTSEAQLFNQLMTEYTMPAMEAALQCLRLQARAWRTAGEGRSYAQAIDTWTNAFGRPADHNPAVDARRLVASYFWRTSSIIEMGLVTGGLMEELRSVAGKEIMYDVVLPMERALARTIGDEASTERLIARFTRALPRTGAA